jgi:hypothetical protein
LGPSEGGYFSRFHYSSRFSSTPCFFATETAFFRNLPQGREEDVPHTLRKKPMFFTSVPLGFSGYLGLATIALATLETWNKSKARRQEDFTRSRWVTERKITYPSDI